ncbi:MAG: O-antigen ligase family protein [Spirochaetota bacterium]
MKYPGKISLAKASYFFLALFLVASGISISASQISLGTASLLLLADIIKNRKSISTTGLERYILPFVAVSFVLCFASPQVLKNLNYIRDFWLIFAFILAYYLHNSREDILKTFYLITFIVLFQSIIALVQVSFNISFINEAHKIGIFHYGSPDDSLRVRGGLLGMHLVFSCYLMLIAIPVLFVSAGAVKNVNAGIRWVMILAAVLAVIALLEIRSRSIIIALPFALVPIFFVSKKLRIIFLLFFLVLILLAGALLTYRGQDQISSHTKGNAINTESTDQRIKIWKTAFYVWLNHPVIGTGGGNYLDEFKQMLSEHPELDAGMITHAHNDYLNQLARKGVIGLLAFVYMLFGIFKYMTVNLKSVNDKLLKSFYLGLFGAYCVFITASFFQCYYTDDENLVMFWFVIGLSAAVAKIEKQANES